MISSMFVLQRCAFTFMLMLVIYFVVYAFKFLQSQSQRVTLIPIIYFVMHYASWFYKVTLIPIIYFVMLINKWKTIVNHKGFH